MRGFIPSTTNNTEPIPSTPPNAISQTTTPPKKGCCTCLNCFLALAIFFFISFMISASLAAASGIFKVPLLSRIFYHEPNIANNYPAFDTASFQKKIESMTSKSSKSQKEVRVTITEAEASGYLMGLSQNQIIKTADISRIEKADCDIKKDNVSALFNVYSPKKSRSFIWRDRVWFNIEIIPKISPDKIDFSIKKIKIGNLRIPTFGFNIFKSYLLKMIPQEQQGLTGVELSDGSAVIILNSNAIEKK